MNRDGDVCFTIRYRQFFMYAYKTFKNIYCSPLNNDILKIYRYLFPKCLKLEFFVPLL